MTRRWAGLIRSILVSSQLHSLHRSHMPTTHTSLTSTSPFLINDYGISKMTSTNFLKTKTKPSTQTRERGAHQQEHSPPHLPELLQGTPGDMIRSFPPQLIGSEPHTKLTAVSSKPPNTQQGFSNRKETQASQERCPAFSA